MTKESSTNKMEANIMVQKILNLINDDNNIKGRVYIFHAVTWIADLIVIGV